MGAKSSGLFSSLKTDGTKRTSGKSHRWLASKGWGRGVLSKEEKKKEKVERDIQQHDAKTTLKQRKSVFSRITSIFRQGGA